MLRSRRVLAAGLLVLLVLLAGVGARAEDEPFPPHVFDDGIQAARRELQTGDCKLGLAALQALLESHRGRDYAKGRRAEIEELMRQLACGAEFERPDPEDMLSGKLERWSPESGAIRIKWTPETKKDFEERGGLLYLPARLVGPFKFEVKGKTYTTSADALPRMVLAGDQHPETGRTQGWTIEFGVPSANKRERKALVPARIRHADGTSEETLVEKDRVGGKAGKAYKLVLRVTKTKITAAVGSRRIGSIKKPPEVFGYLAFSAWSWTEAKLTGVIDPDWLQERVDEVLHTQLEAFEKSYDASKHIPDWLSGRLTNERYRPRKKEVDLLAEIPDEHYKLMQDVFNDIRMDEFDSALSRIDQLQAAGVKEATCEYMRAEVRMRMTQLEPALVHIGRCVELEPAFLEGVLMKGSLLQQLGRFSEALDFFEQATAEHAHRPKTYEEAAQAMLLAGRPADSKRITQLAARNGVFSDRLVTLGDALAKVVRGPRWKKRYGHKSHNYHVLSNMDQNTCVEAAKLLEEAFDAYRKTMGFVERDTTRLFKVYLFNTREGFLGYQGDLEEFMGKPAEKAAGLYSPLLKQLLIWNLPSRDDMMETIRHEGFHQYLDRIMPNPPVWFNEGLAVYHENGKVIDGKLTFGQMHPNYVRLLQQRGLGDLEKFLYFAPSKFYEGSHHSYAQGWLLVHMLQHTTPAYRALFDAMVEELKTQSSFEVIQRHFPNASLPDVQRDLRAYLEKLAS
jgi:tetratricopeptide (TPR) repeat protein